MRKDAPSVQRTEIIQLINLRVWKGELVDSTVEILVGLRGRKAF